MRKRIVILYCKTKRSNIASLGTRKTIVVDKVHFMKL